MTARQPLIMADSCIRRMSAKASGGVKPMVSLITNSTLLSVVPSPCSEIGTPCLLFLVVGIDLEFQQSFLESVDSSIPGRGCSNWVDMTITAWDAS